MLSKLLLYLVKSSILAFLPMYFAWKRLERKGCAETGLGSDFTVDYRMLYLPL